MCMCVCVWIRILWKDIITELQGKETTTSWMWFAGRLFFKVQFGVHFEKWKKPGNVYFGERGAVETKRNRREFRETLGHWLLDIEIGIDYVIAERSTKSGSISLSELWTEKTLQTQNGSQKTVAWFRLGEKIHIGRLIRVNWDLVMETKEVKIEFLEKIVEFKPEPSQLDNLYCSLTSE